MSGLYGSMRSTGCRWCGRARLAAVFVAGLLVADGHAGIKVWDFNTVNTGAQDGPGTWTTGGNTWWTGTANSAWASGDTAIFGAGADGDYTINLGGDVTTGNNVSCLTFSNGTYRIQSGDPRTITAGTLNQKSFIKVMPEKTAVIGDHVTVRKGGTGEFVLFGGGRLVVGSGTPGGGAVLTNQYVNAGEMRNGSTLEVAAGGTVNLATSFVLGTLSNNETNMNTLLRINGGAMTIGMNNLVLGNNSAGQVSGAQVVITDGSLTVGATGGGGLRYGTTVVGAGTVTTGKVHLAGGTLTVGKVYQGIESDGGVTDSRFQFDGGTLCPSPGTTNGLIFMTGLDQSIVRDGGAVIDSNGQNITIGQALEHSQEPGDAAVDGGLTKRGSGTLALTGANSYTGPTVVEGGTLSLDAAAALPEGTPVSLGDGATLALNGYAVSLPMLSGIGGSAAVTATSGGSLSVTNQIVVGGSGAVGVLTLPDTTLAPGGELAMEIAADGVGCDQIVAAGTLTLTGTTLTIANPETLDRLRIYTLVTGSSPFGDLPTLAGAPAPWMLKRVGNTVVLTIVKGAMLGVY